jgi:hypothetical protein
MHVFLGLGHHVPGYAHLFVKGNSTVWLVKAKKKSVTPCLTMPFRSLITRNT